MPENAGNLGSPNCTTVLLPAFALVASLLYPQPVHCVVTAGPTYEPLDSVRRLTNFSTGRLGSELAQFLTVRGHHVTLLLGEHSTYHPELQKVQLFGTTADLEERLRAASQRPVEAVFHAAAVSDFKFGKVWRRSQSNDLIEVSGAKISTRQGPLLAELLPTVKILSRLRKWFPSARLVGWKFEVEGERAHVIRVALDQISECGTDACVANGPAYGPGFGLITPETGPVDLPDKPSLFEALLAFVQPHNA